MLGAGGALPAALGLGRDGGDVALHVVTQVTRVAKQHLVLENDQSVLRKQEGSCTHVIARLITDEAGLAVDALPGLGVDLIRQVLGVIQTGGVNCTGAQGSVICVYT